MSNFIVPLSSLPPISSITDSQAAQKTGKVTGENIPFMNYLQDAVENLAETSAQSQLNMYGLAVGATDDLHTGAIDALKASTAVSYTTGIASAAIRAYNELIKMQI